MTVTELLLRGYEKRIVMGSLAGAGTLGFLIPPSIIMIIYGVLAEVSILKLFIAGVVPGLLLALAYMIYLGIYSTIRRDATPASEEAFTAADRLRSVAELGPVLFLILLIPWLDVWRYRQPRPRRRRSACSARW